MAERIVYTAKAFSDIDKIVEFNNRRNQSDTYSKKFVSGLDKRLKKLLKSPLTGKPTNEPDVMLLVWDNYYIFYIVFPLSIEITSIYHQRENIDY